jgi:alpha-tubulin suppressor-like RCC1 family protein
MKIIRLVMSFFLISLIMVVPTVASSPKIVAISAGPMHCLALGEDRSVWAWGSNWRGELTGIRDDMPHEVPRLLPITNVKMISAGGFDSVLLKDDGTVWWWGKLPNDMAGVNSDTFNLIQVPITNITAVYAGPAWAFAVKDDGTVWGWGSTSRGDLGIGEYSKQIGSDMVRMLPVQSKITNVTHIEGDGCFAVKDDGTLWAWGSNTYYSGSSGYDGVIGKLGNFTDNIIPIPVKVETFSDVKSVSSGLLHTLVLKNDGTVWAWGSNYNGQLGDGGKIALLDRTMGLPQIQNGIAKSKIENIAAVSAGSGLSIALKDDGTVWTWGINPDSTYGSSTPSKVDGISDAIAISAGDNFYMALKSDGSVWVWGNNKYGQAGNIIGSQSYLRSPVKITFDYNNKMPDAVMVTTDALALQQTPDKNIGASVTPLPIDTSNNSIPTPTLNTGASDNTNKPLQGDGFMLEIVGVLTLIVLIVGVALLIKRK